MLYNFYICFRYPDTSLQYNIDLWILIVKVDVMIHSKVTSNMNIFSLVLLNN
jgi:hypothetical protein